MPATEIKAQTFPAALDLSTLDGSNGFVLNGIDDSDYSGGSVSGAGDVNGDGVDDLLIGAYDADPNGNAAAGETYVVFGQSGGFPASMELSDLDGSNGFVLNGIDVDDNSGISVSRAGDVNDDGVDDLLIGARDGDPNGNSSAGETYVVFGNAAPTVANAIPDQQTDEDQDFNFIVPANTFDDVNAGDVLTLSATLAGGGALPSWLTFTPGTETFNGTPANDDVGTISIEVTATDPGGLFVSDLFDLEVVNTNDAPVLASIGAQSGDEGTQITFTASATDVDLPANTLTFSLDATSLGKGMTIEANAGIFGWTPSEAQSGSHDVTVTVSDGTLTDSETVTITITGLTLGTEDELNTSVNIYPNPAIDRISIAELPQAHSVTIYSMSGAKVLHSIVKEGIVDISSLQSDTYIVEITDKAGLVLLLHRLLKAN